MIKCFVHKDGYYVVGDGIEEAKAVTPVTSGSELAYDDVQHVYLVMAEALSTLRGRGKDQIHVFNDSRMIDDMQGNATLGSWFDSVRQSVMEGIIPDITAIVMFKKISERELTTEIAGGFARLEVHSPQRDAKIRRGHEMTEQEFRDAMLTKATNLRRRWFDAKTN